MVLSNKKQQELDILQEHLLQNGFNSARINLLLLYIMSGVSGVDDLPINELKSLNCFGVFSNLDNAYIDDDDNELHTDTQAQAYFQRNVDIGGSLRLGIEVATTDAVTGVTTYTDTGGNILVKINGITYTLTPQILKYLSTITSDYATTISSLAPKNSPTFTGPIFLNSNSVTIGSGINGDTTIFGNIQQLGTSSLGATNLRASFGNTFVNNLQVFNNLTLGDVFHSGGGGNVLVKINAITYTLTPQILSYLSTITSDIQTQVNSLKDSPTFTGATTTIQGDLYLGQEVVINLGMGHINYLGTGGNIIFKYLHTTYTITPQILTYLVNISSDIQAQINNLTTNTPDLSSYATLASPTFTGIPLAPTPDTTDDSTQIATTAFVRAQGYLTSVTPPDLSSYAPKDNPTFTTKITTPYFLLSAPIYCELGGNYEPVDIVATPSLQANTHISNYDKTYTSVNDIFGYQIVNSTGLGGSVKVYYEGNFRNYAVSGYDKSLYGFNTLTGNWKCPQTGKYNICVSFYIKSNNAGNKFSLNRYASDNTLLSSQYCLAGDTISTDTIRNFTTILPMNTNDYFKIVLTTYAGNAVMRFEGMQYTTMKIMLLG
jgi:hypothetical protein